MATMTTSPNTVGAAIEWGAALLDSADVYFGHGTDNSIDEAAALVFHVAGLAHDGDPSQYERALMPDQRQTLDQLFRRRVEQRIPVAYLINEAWFAGLSFFVDERVLIPRSPFAELIGHGFEPWLAPSRVGRLLEIGTGSGCIAVACARAFPHCEVVATDISSAALDVARINTRRHGVEQRVQLLEADIFDGVSGRFDLIVSNPPYVPAGQMRDLPAEFGYEPGGALASGDDGLDSTRRILQDAPSFLRPAGLLALEVGSGWTALEAAFPNTPFIWPMLEHGGEGIALLPASEPDADSSR